jgi:hypothetical protein
VCRPYLLALESVNEYSDADVVTNEWRLAVEAGGARTSKSERSTLMSGRVDLKVNVQDVAVVEKAGADE